MTWPIFDFPNQSHKSKGSKSHKKKRDSPANSDSKKKKKDKATGIDGIPSKTAEATIVLVDVSDPADAKKEPAVVPNTAAPYIDVVVVVDNILVETLSKPFVELIKPTDVAYTILEAKNPDNDLSTTSQVIISIIIPIIIITIGSSTNILKLLGW